MDISPEGATAGVALATAAGLALREAIAWLGKAATKSRSVPPPAGASMASQVREIHDVVARRDEDTDGYVLPAELKRARIALERLVQILDPTPQEPRQRAPSVPGE